MSREPVKAVHEAMDDSNNWMNGILTFMTNLLAPEDEEEEGIFYIESALHSTVTELTHWRKLNT